MPGSSLWLLPPLDHPVNAILTSLIQKTSRHFNSPYLFIPHITLTSEISPSVYAASPQEWLDTLEFPEDEKNVHIEFERLQSEDVFVRKLYIKVKKKDGGLKELGRVARRNVEGFGKEYEGKAAEWVEEQWNPHLSLLYHDCPRVSEADILSAEQRVREAGIALEGDAGSEFRGWVGGRVVLVPTDRPIKEWTPIAERKL